MNICVEAHLRELVEEEFKVVVVKNAKAAPRHPGLGDGYRTHLTSFAGVLGFEVSRYFAINNRACLTRLFFARTGIKPASCKAFSFRNRSQMGSIEPIWDLSIP